MGASAILKLQKVGFTIDQVEALADFMDTQAASKADLEAVEHRLELKIGELRSDLEATEHRLELKIGEVKSDLEASINGLRAENIALNGRIDRLEERMERRMVELESRLIRWMSGIGIASALTLAGAAWKIIQTLQALPLAHP